MTTGPAGVGLAFQSDKHPADYERLAAGAEQYGFDVLSVFGDLYFPPPVPALLAMARATSAITLGPACLNPYMMHPIEIAGQMAALDLASDGRAFLGLCRGAWLGDLGTDQRRGPETVAEAARVVAALMSGDRTGVAGDSLRPAGGGGPATPAAAKLAAVAHRHLGPRLCRLAGAIADEVKVGGSANPAMVPLVRGWADAGATAAGRPGRPTGIVIGAVTVVDEDGRLARAKARQEVAMYIDVVGRLDPTVQMPVGWLDAARTGAAGLRGEGGGGARPR